MARTFARPLNDDDADALTPIDQAYALAFDLEPSLTRSSLSFFIRTGHAFVSVRNDQVTGFALAQAIWNGTRPTVYLSRLAVSDQADTPSREALVEAVTKSAYAAAVYDLLVLMVGDDRAGLEALGRKDYYAKPIVVLERVLGSRARSKET